MESASENLIKKAKEYVNDIILPNTDCILNILSLYFPTIGNMICNDFIGFIFHCCVSNLKIGKIHPIMIIINI